MGNIVSQVSEHAEVRAALLPLQRRIAAAGPVVMVGAILARSSSRTRD